MPANLSIKNWSRRVKNAAAALLFLTAYTISAVGPFVPVASAALLPGSDVSVASFPFGIKNSSSYSESAGIPTAQGSFKNGNVGAYVEGACIPTVFEVTNNSDTTGDIYLAAVFDHYNAPTVGIDNLEPITYTGTDNPVDTITNLNQLTYPKTDLSTTSSFKNSSTSITSASVTGPYSGNSTGTSSFVYGISQFGHYNILLSDVLADETVYVAFCARLSLDASDYNGSSLSIRTAGAGAENIPIPVNSLLKRPSITLTKVVATGNALPSDFSFTVTPSINGQSVFDIPDGKDSVLIDNVYPDGAYKVVESGPSGYSFASGDGTSCVVDQTTIGSASGTMFPTVAAAKNPTNATCIFTNEINKGSITIVKDATPNGDQAFDFSATGVSPTTFALTDDGTVANTKEFKDLTPGKYTFSEDGETGWDLKSIICTGAQSSVIDTTLPTATINLAAGENITCTFSNTQRGHIIIKKVTDPASDTTTQFEFNPSWSAENFKLTNTGSQDSGALEPGTYDVTELATDGWKQTNVVCDDGSKPGAISVSAGETVTCTFTNTKLGSVEIVKDAVPNAAQEFDFTVSGDATDSFKLVDDGTASNAKKYSDLLPGSYKVTESATSGWDFDGLSCSGATVDKDGAAVTITLKAGENVKCTFTNRMHGQIIVQKTTKPSGSQQTFGVTASSSDGGLLPSGTTGTVSDSADAIFTIQQGKHYSVTEKTPAGWTQTSNSCSNLSVNGNSTMVGGVPTVYCEIVNTQLATLTIKKVTDPKSDPAVFGFLAGGQVSEAFLLSDTQTKTFDSLTPGQEISVDEATVSGWKLTGLTCDNQNVATNLISGYVTFVPQAGESATCTFTNTKLGSISGYKYEVNADNSIVNPAASWEITLYLNSNPTGDTYITGSDGYYVFPDLLPGEYSVTETLISGWTQQYSPSAITLSSGENSTNNNFGNFKNGSVNGYKFNDINGDGVKDANEPKLENWTVKLTGKTEAGADVSDSAKTDGSGNYSFTNLAPGAYEVCEEQQSGWAATTPDCQKFDIDKSGETNEVAFGNQGRGTITVVKNVDDGFGNVTKDVDGWYWNYDGMYESSSSDIETGSSNTQNAAADGYYVYETQQKNYHLTSVSCSNDQGMIQVAQQGETVYFELMPGENVVCTYLNTRDAAKITVTKIVNNNHGGQAQVSDFDLYVNKDKVTSGVSNLYLTDVEYTVDEIMNVSGYEQASISCWVAGQQALTALSVGLGNTFTLEYGKDVECKIVNNDIAPKLTVYKFVDNGFTNLTKTPGDFTIYVDGTNISNDEFAGDSNGTTVTLNAGAYEVTEGDHTGYSMWTSGACDTTIAVGQEKTCYIYNEAIEDPQINVVKSGPTQAHEGDTVTYTFEVTNPGNVPFPDVQVEDTIAGTATYVSGDANDDGYLDPGETWLYTADYVIPADQVDDVYNVVEACGSYGYFDDYRFVEQESEGYRTVCDDDDHTLDVLHPSVMVEKDGPANALLGSTGTYTFTVTNTGDIALELTKVLDTIAGVGVYQSGDTNDDGMLDLAETWVYTATYKFTQLGDVVNTVTVCGTDPLQMEVCDDDDHTTIVYQPQVLGLEDTGDNFAAPLFLSSGFLGLAIATMLNRRKHGMSVK